MAEPIRAGIIGASVNRGQGWRSHVPALLKLPEYKLTAICTAHKETAEEAAAATGAEHAFWDYRDLVASPDIDLVAVCVRVPWHKEMCLAAIDAGKHVYCEWPVAVNSAEMEEMATAARKRGVKAMAGLQARAAPSIEHLKRLIEGGYVGEPRAVHALFTTGHPYLRQGLPWTLRRENGNHVLSIYGGHMIDILSYALGGLREVSARVATTVKQWPLPDGSGMVDADAPDWVDLLATTGSGAILSASFGYVRALPGGWRAEVYGDEGTLVASTRGPAMGLPNKLEGGRSDERELKEIAVPPELVKLPSGYPIDTSYHVAHMYRRLAEAIRDGVPVQPDFTDALRLHRLLEMVERSGAEGGKWLAIEAKEATR
jgi:predicted dehydrogenase